MYNMRNKLNKHMSTQLLWFCVTFFSWSTLFSQNITQDAPGQAKLLKQGVLVIILNNNTNQINYLKAIIDNEKSDKKSRDHAQKSMDAITTRTDNFNRIIRHAFDSVYQYSEVRYIFQKDFKKEDVSSNNQHFLDRNNVVNPDLSIGNKPYLIMSYMDRTTASGSTALSLRLLLPDKSEAHRNIQFPGVGNIINIMLDNGKYKTAENMLIKRIIKFQKHLRNNYVASLKLE